MSGPRQQPKRMHWHADVQNNQPRPREERPWDYCFFCKTEEHTLLTCDLNPQRKLVFLRYKRLCTSCLGRRHRQSGCPDTEVEVCKVCGERHFDFIHHSPRGRLLLLKLDCALSCRPLDAPLNSPRPFVHQPLGHCQSCSIRSTNLARHYRALTLKLPLLLPTPAAGTQPLSNVSLMQHAEQYKRDSTRLAQQPK